MEEIKLRDEFIKLGQAIKAANLVESGAEAKEVIQEGYVKVNGEVKDMRTVIDSDCEFEVLTFDTEEGKKKAQKQKHSNNLCFMDSLCNNIIYLATDRSPEEEIFACETAIKLWTTLIYDNNFLFYHCRIADIYSHLARSHAKLEHREETLESLQKAFEHAKK